jgi:uncharacterized membrane protein YdbT with pleckstrin-like domain
MPYYSKVLQPGEEVKYYGKLHWTIYAHTIIWIGLALGAGAASIASDQDSLVFSGAIVILLVFLFLALISFFNAWFRRWTTEIVVTNKRIIYKRGWIAIRTEEMNITKVETVDVRQPVLGRILGYGTVLIRGMGSSWEPLQRVAAPVSLRNAIVVG